MENFLRSTHKDKDRRHKCTGHFFFLCASVSTEGQLIQFNIEQASHLCFMRSVWTPLTTAARGEIFL